MKSVSVNVPASIANLGPGYDVFGMALSLYNKITVELAEENMITVSGTKADDSLPLDEDNLVFSSMKVFYNHIGKECPKLNVNIECNIPLASGMGSSSTAILGGITAVNKLEGEPLTIDQLATLAWQIEGHPDNTTPALLGGFVMSAITSENKLVYKKLEWPKEWKIIICHPDFKLSTQEARAILPAQVPLKDAIFNISCSSFFVAAVCTKDSEALKRSLDDKLHQPYRSKLVPGLTEIMKELKEHDVLGTVLSGAGPSICIITKAENTDQIVETVTSIWQKENIGCEFFFPEVDNNGVHYV